MKTAGIVLICISALDLIVALIALGDGSVKGFSTYFNGFLMFGALGGYLMYRANKKKKEEEEKKRWENGNSN